MAKPAVTVDFHNTLIECEPWFHLEVRTLVSSVLDWAAAIEGVTPETFDRETVDREYRRLRQAIHEHGHELEAERAVSVVLDRVGISLDQDVVDTAVRELMGATLQHALPVEGASQFLGELRSAGAGVAIVSSAVYHPFLEWALETHSMRDMVDVVITSASCGFYKSRPEIYWTALRALNSPATLTAHVGDSLRFDVGGAKTAGLRAAWYDRKGASDPLVPRYGPDLVFTDMATASTSVLDLTMNGATGQANRRIAENRQ